MGDWLLIADGWFWVEINPMEYHPIINRQSLIETQSTINNPQIIHALDRPCPDSA